MIRTKKISRRSTSGRETRQHSIMKASRIISKRHTYMRYQRRNSEGTVAVREIRRYQRGTNLLLPIIPF